MHYCLAPGVTIASREDLLIFEDSTGELFDIHLDKDLHLALLQILLANTPLESYADFNSYSDLTGILEGLKDNLLISEVSYTNPGVLFEDASNNLYFTCFGVRSREIALLLGAQPSPTQHRTTDHAHIFLVDSVSRICAMADSITEGRDYIVCEVGGARVQISPVLGPSTGISARDWLNRRLAASWWPHQQRVRIENGIYFSEQHDRPNSSQLHAVRQHLNALARSANNTDTFLQRQSTTIDLAGKKLTSHVLPIPHLHTPAAPSNCAESNTPTEAGTSPSTTDLCKILVSKETCIVRELDLLPSQPWWPQGLHVVEAKISDIEAVLGWPADRISAGASWDDPDLAIASALGEAIERYCSNAIPDTGYVHSSFTRLQAKNLPAISPKSFALFSPGQYAASGFPFVPFTDELPTDWVWGTSLLSGKATLAPAQLTYVNWYYLKDNSSPTNVTMFAGIAAGPSKQFAEISALEELIERDAAHIWWHGRLPAKAVLLNPSSPVAKRMATLPKDWRYSLFSIPSPSGVPVIGCLLLHKADQLLSLGIASRLNAETAALKAIAEAVQLHEYARGLTDENGTIWSAVRDRIITGQNLKPVRADRAYLDSYRTDFHDVVDLPCQMQVYLDPRAHSFVDAYWQPEETITLDALTIPYDGPEEQHNKLLSLVAKQASEIVSVDVTTSEIKDIGLRVLRVLAPGLYGNSPTAFPYFGGSRLAKAMRSHYGEHVDWQKLLRLEPPPYA